MLASSGQLIWAYRTYNILGSVESGNSKVISPETKYIWSSNLESRSLPRRFRRALSHKKKAWCSEKGPRVKLWALIKEPFELDWILPPPKHSHYFEEVLDVSWWSLKWKVSTDTIQFSPFISDFISPWWFMGITGSSLLGSALEPHQCWLLTWGFEGWVFSFLG